MTVQSKAIVQRVLAAVLAAALIGLTGAVLTNRDKVTVLEVKIQGIETSQERLEGQLETNRKENNAQHERIIDEIRRLKK